MILLVVVEFTLLRVACAKIPAVFLNKRRTRCTLKERPIFFVTRDSDDITWVDTSEKSDSTVAALSG